MNANFAKTFSTTFPSIARNTFQSTNYKTNRDSSTGFSPSIKHKGKKKTKRAVSPSSMSISQATTDDTIFAMNEINIIDEKINKRKTNRQQVWKLKTHNNIYGINATKNNQDIQNIKKKVKLTGGWETFDLRGEIEKKKYFPVENVDTMLECQKIIKEVNEKENKEKKSYKQYSNDNKIDLYTFTRQNRDICLKNILIQLLQSERDKIANKENAVSTALLSAKNELNKDMEEFTSFTENQKVSFRTMELTLNKMIRENKIRNERKRQLTQEVKNTQDEIEKTIRNILLYKTYADFIHSVMGTPNKVSEVNLTGVDLLNKDRDLEKNIIQVKSEFKFLEEDKVYEPEILKNPDTLNYIFTQFEANILKYINIKEEIDNENYKESLENEKTLKELERKEEANKKEYKELSTEFSKKSQMINDGGKNIQEEIAINSKFIKELYESICENRSYSLTSNGGFIKARQITEIIKEILEALNKKEEMINGLIEEMEYIQNIKDDAGALFKKLDDKKKNENKIEKYKEGKEKLQKLEEEKNLKYQQRMYRYKIKGPITYPPPNVLNNKRKKIDEQSKNKINENDMLYYI